MSTSLRVNHHYLVDARMLDATNGKEYDLSESIEDIMVRKRFITDCFPQFVIDLRLTQELRDLMRDHEFSVYLRISVYNSDDSTTNDNLDSAEVAETEILFDGEIRIYDKPFTTTASKKEEETTDGQTQVESVPVVYYRLSGIPEALISKNETTMNAVFEDAELADVLVYELTSIDQTSQMYIQETDNKEVFHNIISPPVSLIESLDFIDSNYYHFYENGYNLFFDSDSTYVYDPMCTNENELVLNRLECNILSPEETNDGSRLGLPSLDEDGNISVSFKNLPAFSNQKKIASHTLGSHTVYYFYDDNFNLINRFQDNNESFSKTRYLWSNMRERSDRVLNKSATISFTISNLSPKYITPLTLLRLNAIQYPDIAGDYLISEVAYTLSSGDMKHFTSNISLLGIKK